MNIACPLDGSAGLAVAAHEQPATFTDPLLRCPQCGLEFRAAAPPPPAGGSYYSSPHYAATHSREDTRKAMRLWRRIRRLRPNPGRYLEIGPGLGLGAHLARVAGWQVEVVEPDTALHPCYAGMRIHAAALADAALDPPYHLTVMADVLEHFRDPVAMLRKAAAASAPDGWLAIETPNRGSFYARVAGPRWVAYSPWHAAYYARPQLDKLLRQTGWQPESWSTSPLDLLSLDGFWRVGGHAAVSGGGATVGAGKSLRRRLLASSAYWLGVTALNALPNLLAAPFAPGDQLIVLARRSAS